MKPLDIGYAIAAAATAPFWMNKARGGWAQRFGRLEPLPPPVPGRPRVLLHAVSVGEAQALRTLAPLLSEGHDLVISAGTDTGLATAQRLYGAIARVVRYPLDFSFAVGRFLDAVRPDAVGLVELELWPHFTAECGRRGVPVAVINGRLSARSFRGYRRFRAAVGPMFRRLALAAVQDDGYAQRFIEMGVPAERVVVTGSMKWDNTAASPGPGAADAVASALGLDRSMPIILAGSTGPGEEALLHAACAGLGAQLVCAPRKPERFDEAALAMPGCVRRSRPGEGDPAGGRFLLDTIGELSALYALADIVVMGRSFGDLHGSDPTEPAGLGKPVVIGPAVSDFAAIVRALEEAGGLVRATRESLGHELAGLLAQPERARAIGERARACVLAHRGASERHAALMARLARGQGDADHAAGRADGPGASGASGAL